MDILIKNMELPKACSWFDEEGKFHACRFDYACICSITGECIASSVERRHPSCPLVELPPHGDLISKASVLSLLRYYCDMREYKKDIRCKDCENWNACVVRPIMDEVNKLDTVLEAST